MINIKLQDLPCWLQQKLDQKYGYKLELLKKTFLVFYNLTQQIISLYTYILEQSKKLTFEEDYAQQFQPLKEVVLKTTLILHKLIENQKLVRNEVGAINLTFCQKFIRNFGENLNILCTLYHSLNHCQFVSNRFEHEKGKIVEGINKLYTIQNKIKQLFKKNEHYLKNMETQRRYVQYSIKKIKQCRQDLYKKTGGIFKDVEDQVIEFYTQFNETVRYTDKVDPNSDPAQQAIKSLMKSYFRIYHSFCEAQAELEYYLKPIVIYCEQLKNKKKTINYTIADSINVFRRITSQLLKSSYSLKNFKKIKLEELNKSICLLLQEMVNNNSIIIDLCEENKDILGHRMFKLLEIGYYENSGKKDQRLSKNQERDKERDKDKGISKQKEKNKWNMGINPKDKSKKIKYGQINDKKKQKQQKEGLNSFEDNIQDQEQKDNQPEQQNLHPHINQAPQSDKRLWYPQSAKQKIQLVVEQICQCGYFIMDCMKQLEKVQNTGLINMIQQYKQKLNVNYNKNSQIANSNENQNSQSQMNILQSQDSRRLISKLCQYQVYIGQYYKLHEHIKQFQKGMKQIILIEFKIKMNIQIGIEPIAKAKQQGSQHKNNKD